MFSYEPKKTRATTHNLVYTAQFEFPSQVMIVRRIAETKEVQQVCSGTILTRNIILSTAYCLIAIDPYWEYVVYAGTPAPDLIFLNPYKQIRIGTVIIKHEKHMPGYWPNINDIALLRLNTPLVYNRAIKPAKIAPYQFLYKEKSVHVLSGWTQNDPAWPWSKKQNVSMVNPVVCKWFFPAKPTSTVCAYGGKSVNEFTTGTAIYTTHNGITYLTGLHNQALKPQAYFTQIYSYRAWLKTKIGGSYFP